MKTKILGLFLLTMVQMAVLGQTSTTSTVIYKGLYCGKNILVKNPFDNSQSMFSVREVKINGVISTAEINNEIFEIALDHPYFKFKTGDLVTVEIIHVTNCFPKTLPTIFTPGALISEENASNKKEDRFVINGQFNYGQLYLINPFNSSNKSFCIRDIRVNGLSFKTRLDKELVTVDLSSLGDSSNSSGEIKKGLKSGDNLQIEIICSKDNSPTFINADLITPFATKQ